MKICEPVEKIGLNVFQAQRLEAGILSRDNPSQRTRRNDSGAQTDRKISEVNVHDCNVFEGSQSRANRAKTLEHFASVVDGCCSFFFMIIPLTSGTGAGSRFSAGRSRTEEELRLTCCRSSQVLRSGPPVFFCPRLRKLPWT